MLLYMDPKKIRMLMHYVCLQGAIGRAFDPGRTSGLNDFDYQVRKAV